MANVMDTLKQRGFVKQTVYEEELYKLLSTESVPFYIGFDPTADSLHIGHYVQLVAMRHMQLAGHKPYILVGGGTGFIGDPSGRTDMRSMMTPDIIERNCRAFQKQMSRLLDFDGDNAAVMVNNADWLLDLKYVEFLRDIGVHFSVNRMLTADCFKQRLEKGLSFFEFNYMLMQAYDFYKLYMDYGCLMQMGGDDQWSNILAGVDLIRRKLQKPAYAMTFALLTTSEGAKMGKTAKGAVWLDAEKTSPYDFYQYFRNVDDADVETCFKLLTFLPVEEIAELTKYRDQRMNDAKERLAYEVTRLIHGENAADAAKTQARAAFGGGDADLMPTVEISESVGCKIVDILVSAGVSPSKAEAKRQIMGGGVSVNDEVVKDIMYEIDGQTYQGGSFIVHRGKKVRVKVQIVE